MSNRRFVRRLDPSLRKTENPRTVMREQVKKPPPAQREYVREALPVRHDIPVELRDMPCKKVDIRSLEDQGGRG